MRSTRRYSAVTKPLAGALAIVVLLAAAIFAVRLGDGDYSSSYQLTASFSEATAGLHTGSQVEERGVQIGSVRSIVLHHRRAMLTFDIYPDHRIASGAIATIEPENLFGADQVAISPGPKGASSFLREGGRIAHTRVLDELGRLFSSADPLLGEVDTRKLSTVVNELAGAYGGEGHEIASALKAGSELTSLLARTSSAQLAALDAFSRFSVVLEGEGPRFNKLASDANLTAPLFNRAEGDYQVLLRDLSQLSEKLSSLLSDYRPQLDTLISSGDDVLRVLLTRRSDVVSLLKGLAQYAYRFGEGESSATLPDGSHFAYFKTFVVWTDLQRFVCNLLAPDESGLSFLEPLQKAVLSGNTMLNCSSELSSFDAAQQTGSAPASSAPPALKSSASQAAEGVYGAIAAPEPPSPETIGSYVDSLLPAGIRSGS